MDVSRLVKDEFKKHYRSNSLEREKETRCFVKESALVKYLDKLKKEFTLNLEEITVNVRLLIFMVRRHNDQLVLLAKEQDSLKTRVDNLEKIQTSSSISLMHMLASTRILKRTKTLSLTDFQDSFDTDSNNEG